MTVDEPKTALRCWYDTSDPKLTRVFPELQRRRNVLHKRTGRKPFWKRWYTYGPVALIVAFTPPAPTIIIGSLAILFVLTMDLLLPKLAAWRFKALAVGIHDGDFGYAVMWEGEAVWTLLDKAATQQGFVLTDLFADKALNAKITPTLAAMLVETGYIRGKLSATRATWKHPAAIRLAEQVNNTIQTIATIYNGHALRS